MTSESLQKLTTNTEEFSPLSFYADVFSPPSQTMQVMSAQLQQLRYLFGLTTRTTMFEKL